MGGAIEKSGLSVRGQSGEQTRRSGHCRAAASACDRSGATRSTRRSSKVCDTFFPDENTSLHKWPSMIHVAQRPRRMDGEWRSGPSKVARPATSPVQTQTCLPSFPVSCPLSFLLIRFTPSLALARALVPIFPRPKFRRGGFKRSLFGGLFSEASVSRGRKVLALQPVSIMQPACSSLVRFSPPHAAKSPLLPPPSGVHESARSDFLPREWIAAGTP